MLALFYKSYNCLISKYHTQPKFTNLVCLIIGTENRRSNGELLSYDVSISIGLQNLVLIFLFFCGDSFLEMVGSVVRGNRGVWLLLMTLAIEVFLGILNS